MSKARVLLACSDSPACCALRSQSRPDHFTPATCRHVGRPTRLGPRVSRARRLSYPECAVSQRFSVRPRCRGREPGAECLLEPPGMCLMKQQSVLGLNTILPGRWCASLHRERVGALVWAEVCSATPVARAGLSGPRSGKASGSSTTLLTFPARSPPHQRSSDPKEGVSGSQRQDERDSPPSCDASRDGPFQPF
jgi:hypothetical protein